MRRTSGLGRQLILSAILSVILSVALSRLLRVVLSAAGGPPEAAPRSEGPLRARGANINPVAVFVIMPILVNNRFGPDKVFPPGRGRRGRLRDKLSGK